MSLVSKRTLLLISVLSALNACLVTAAQPRETCKGNGMQDINFDQDRGLVEAHWITQKNAICADGSMIFFSFRPSLIVKAKHGLAKVNHREKSLGAQDYTPKYAYKPDRGFVGTDKFVVQLVGHRGNNESNEVVTYTVDVNVSVVDHSLIGPHASDLVIVSRNRAPKFSRSLV